MIRLRWLATIKYTTWRCGRVNVILFFYWLRLRICLPPYLFLNRCFSPIQPFHLRLFVLFRPVLTFSSPSHRSHFSLVHNLFRCHDNDFYRMNKNPIEVIYIYCVRHIWHCFRVVRMMEFFLVFIYVGSLSLWMRLIATRGRLCDNCLRSLLLSSLLHHSRSM